MANVLGVQKPLQALSGCKAVQNVPLLVGVQVWCAANGFQLLLPPALLRLVGHVHVLGANRAAISLAQRVQQIAQAHAVFAEERIAGVENGLLVSVAETVKRTFELGNFVALAAFKRVQVGPSGTDVAIGRDQLLHGRAFATHFGISTCHNHPRTAHLGSFSERVDHRKMRHVSGGTTVSCRHVLECVKVVAPGVGDASGVGKVVLVHLFDVRRIAPEKI